MKYETRITRLTVGPERKEIYAPEVTHVEIDDEAAGEFLVLRQNRDDKDSEQTIRIDSDEWPEIVKAVEQLRKGMR